MNALNNYIPIFLLHFCHDWLHSDLKYRTSLRRSRNTSNNLCWLIYEWHNFLGVLLIARYWHNECHSRQGALCLIWNFPTFGQSMLKICLLSFCPLGGSLSWIAYRGLSIMHRKCIGVNIPWVPCWNLIERPEGGHYIIMSTGWGPAPHYQ